MTCKKHQLKPTVMHTIIAYNTTTSKQEQRLGLQRITGNYCSTYFLRCTSKAHTCMNCGMDCHLTGVSTSPP